MKKMILSDKEKILLSRLYKLDRKIAAYMKHHEGQSMNFLLPQTDFIKQANDIYKEMDDKLIKISQERTKYTQNLIV